MWNFILLCTCAIILYCTSSRKTRSRIFAIFSIHIIHEKKYGCTRRHILQPKFRYLDLNWLISHEARPCDGIRNNITPRRKANYFCPIKWKVRRGGTFCLKKKFSRITKHIILFSRDNNGPPRLCLCVLSF